MYSPGFNFICKRAVPNASVTASKNVAGCVALVNGTDYTIEECTNSGNIISEDGGYCGGIVGDANSGTILQCVNDGALEAFETNTAELQRTLWQMKSCGYFKYCKGIIFGRPLFIREDYETSFNEAVKIILEDLQIPVICDADIGHVSPQMAIVNGAILKVTSENGKGIVETKLM